MDKTDIPMKAILTGHSRGLGAAIAAELLKRDIEVLGLARTSNPDLARQFPRLLQEVRIDLADAMVLGRWLSEDILQRFIAGGGTVLLINNAGTVQPVGPLPLQEPADIAQAIGLNIAAPMMLASAVAIAGQNTSDIRILHVSSGAGSSPYAGWSVYCATKAALDLHARSVALDHTPGVRICSLAPGIIDTDMQAEIRATSLEQFPMRERFEALKRDGQLVTPHDCAKQLVDYLLSPDFGNEPVADLRASD